MHILMCRTQTATQHPCSFSGMLEEWNRALESHLRPGAPPRSDIKFWKNVSSQVMSPVLLGQIFPPPRHKIYLIMWLALHIYCWFQKKLQLQSNPIFKSLKLNNDVIFVAYFHWISILLTQHQYFRSVLYIKTKMLDDHNAMLQKAEGCSTKFVQKNNQQRNTVISICLHVGEE